MSLSATLLDLVNTQTFSGVGIVDASDIVFNAELRKSCEANACGTYGRNWKCPPNCGDIDTCISKAKQYNKALVVQYIGELEDSYDFEGMMDAMDVFDEMFHVITDEIATMDADIYPLGAGGCRLCERCAILDQEPCRQPDRAFPSLESHGIFVAQLAPKAGMNYINGQNTVTYFGAFLFNE